MNKVEKIKAEIERRKNQFVSQAEAFHKIGKEDKESYFAALASNMNSLSCFLDTLEVKEVGVDLGDPKGDVGVKTAWTDLEEAANSCSSCIYLEEVLSDDDKEVLKERLVNTFKAGAQWQKERDQSTIELAEDYAYLAGQEKIIAKAIKWLEDNIDRYLYNTGRYGEYIPKCGGKMIEDFKKAMEE